MANKREREKTQARKTAAQAWAESAPQGFEPTSVHLPAGVEFFKPDQGKHEVDFMSYKAGEGNRHADAGHTHFSREFQTHAIQGADGRLKRYCCRYETFGHKRCPVCEYLNTPGIDDQIRKDMRPKTRLLFLVNDEPGAKKPKYKVLDVAYYGAAGNGFGEQLKELITSDDDLASFAEPVGGRTARLTVKEMSMPGSKFNGITRIDFKERAGDYSEEIVDKAPCLDEMLIDLGYEGLKKVLNQEGADDDEKSPSRNGTPKGGDDSDVEDSDIDSDVEEKDEKPKSKKGKKADPDDSDVEDDDDEYYTPAAKKGKATVKDDSDVESDLEEDEDDDEPKKGKGKKVKTAKDCGIKVGMKVSHDDDEWEVKKISGDGTSLTLEDEDGDTCHASPDEVEVIKGGKKAKPADDSDMEEEDDSDVEPAAKKGKKKAADDSDIEDDESPLDSDLEDEDEKPSKKKKAGKR